MTATGRVGITCSGGILYDPREAPPRYLTCRNRAGHGLFVSRQSWSRR